MPARPRNKKHNAPKKQMPAKPVPANDVPEKSENLPAAIATAARPEVKPSPVPATQLAPRRYYIRKELFRVLIVTAVVLAILIILALVLR